MRRLILDIQLDNDILKWLDEDIPYWDVSYFQGDDEIVQGSIIAKDEGVIAGITVAKRILTLVHVNVINHKNDGDTVSNKDEIIRFEGKPSNILRAERVMLNILSHMSGIASKTNKLVKLFQNREKRLRISATRKTLPGLRKYQKWAVIIGGGDTHRIDLSSMALIKENHIAAYGGVSKAVNHVKSKISFSHKIEIEIRSDQEAIEAANTGVDIIMLDNYSAEMADQIIPKIREIDEKVLIEISGGITEETISNYIKSDIDIISLGSLTHSVKAFDVSLLLDIVN